MCIYIQLTSYKSDMQGTGKSVRLSDMSYRTCILIRDSEDHYMRTS